MPCHRPDRFHAFSSSGLKTPVPHSPLNIRCRLCLETYQHNPVSYTHLDVYKRQAHEHKCFAEGKAFILVPISEMIPMAVKGLLIPGADVYKRQPLHHPPSRIQTRSAHRYLGRVFCGLTYRCAQTGAGAGLDAGWGTHLDAGWGTWVFQFPENNVIILWGTGRTERG